MIKENTIIFGLVFLGICFFIYHLVIAHLKNKKELLEKENLVVFKKMFKIVFFIFVLAGIILIIAINFDNFWASLTGILALIGIAFFAVWSLLSNIVAGLIIFASKPFKLKDQITILPEEINGVVKKIGVMFIVLKDSDGNEIKIPNNMVFQKIIKSEGDINFLKEFVQPVILPFEKKIGL